MGINFVIVGIISVLLLIYLVYCLLKPENL